MWLRYLIKVSKSFKTRVFWGGYFIHAERWQETFALQSQTPQRTPSKSIWTTLVSALIRQFLAVVFVFVVFLTLQNKHTYIVVQYIIHLHKLLSFFLFFFATFFWGGDFFLFFFDIRLLVSPLVSSDFPVIVWTEALYERSLCQ